MRFSFDARRRMGQRRAGSEGAFQEIQRLQDGVSKTSASSCVRGDRVALIGSNGVGKTTLFKILNRQGNARTPARCASA